MKSRIDSAVKSREQGAASAARRFGVPCLLLCAVLAGCVRVPDGLEPIGAFDADRYLGTWYEIARLDHPFERGLEQVTATYARRTDGGVSVLNRGYDTGDGEWSSIEGRAYFVEDARTGYLKVSFFGPFYGAYVVLEVDEAYEHALVSGPNRDFLWVLARAPEPDRDVVARLVARADAAGFRTDQLIYVEHDAVRLPGEAPPEEGE